MCTLYSQNSSQEEVAKLARVLGDLSGNLPPMPRIRPDDLAPVVRDTPDGRQLLKIRWGVPGPEVYGGRFVMNVRNVTSKFWRPYLKPEHRCLVPATSFSEYSDAIDPKTKRKTAYWFALSEERPLFFFAGIWREWEGTRGPKSDPVRGRHSIYAFLTTDPNNVVKPIHKKAMPVVLRTEDECKTWLNAPEAEALQLQKFSLPDDALKIVAKGVPQDG